MNQNFWKRRRVLITGHTGFKGSWLSLWLLQAGVELCGISLPPKTEPNLFSLLNLHNKMTSHFSDIKEFGLISRVLNDFKPEIIFHMAAQPLVRYSYQNPIETYHTNVMGTVNVLAAAKEVKSVKAVVNVTTDKCYDNNEWVWGYRENDRLGGHDPYSNSKACAELVTSSFRDSYYKKLGIGLASARAGNVIGGGDWSEDRLIPDIIRNIADNKETIIRSPAAIRPWQHVLEPLSGYIRLAEKLCEKPYEYAEAWNFGPNLPDVADVETVVKNFFSCWPDKKLNYKIQADQDKLHEANFLKLDITKSRELLSWEPKLDLSKAIKWTADWYQAWKEERDLLFFTINQIKEFRSLI